MKKLREILMEQSLSGKTLISVDIQPEYEKNLSFRLPNFIQFLVDSWPEIHDLVFLYNGAETLGMVSEQDYKIWWLENELPEEIVDRATFYDKGYAFFRYCMDSSLDEDVTANFVRFMYQNDIRDSRDMTRDMWAKYLREYRRTDRKEAYELLQHAGDCVNVPDLMDFIKHYNNIVLVGGGVNECLKEVEIALKALQKPYQVYSKYTY